MTDTRQLVVLKVGGSLFSLPDLAKRLDGVLSRFGGPVLLVAGGGASADCVRDLQRWHRFSDHAAHEMALDAMRIGERLLCELVPGAVMADRLDHVARMPPAAGPRVVQMASVLAASEAAGPMSVPHDWSATSDTLALWLAVRLHAVAAVLLKSVDAPPDMATATATGSADQAVQHYAGRAAVLWGNLQRDECELVPVPWGAAAEPPEASAD